MTDPVVGGSLFTPPEPTDQQAHERAVVALVEVLARKWTQLNPEALRHAAEDLVDLGLDVGPNQAVVLIGGNYPDCYRLADAIRRTGPCAKCGGGDYSGVPTEQDLTAAGLVIETMLTPVTGSRGKW